VTSMRVEGRVEWASAARERELVLSAQQGVTEARAQLVDAFTAPIASVARLYRGARGVGREELMQEGVVGLLRAVDRYDPTLGTPFWAYAAWWVRQAMQQVVAELTRPVVLSDRAMRQLARVRNAEREHVRCHRREPTLGELAADTGMTRRQVENLVATERVPRGLDEPVGGEQSGGTVGDRLADPQAEDAYERIPTRVETGAVDGLLERLDGRERAIVRGRYGFDGRKRTLRELGTALGVSAERVRQIEGRALDKLREEALG
jgi:RNA polymerase primary sigma factor